MRTLLLAVLALGCAKAAVTSSGDAANDEADAGLSAPDQRPPDTAAGPDGGAADGAAADVAGFIPPSRRDGGIPRPPPGVPPCAPDSMAADDKACPYQAIVGCAPAPGQVCYCFAPPLDGKWHCEAAPSDGGR